MRQVFPPGAQPGPQSKYQRKTLYVFSRRRGKQPFKAHQSTAFIRAQLTPGRESLDSSPAAILSHGGEENAEQHIQSMEKPQRRGSGSVKTEA